MTITVRLGDGRKEISKAVKAIEAALREAFPDFRGVMPRLIFCEELMLKYAEHGCGSATVRLRKRFRYYWLLFGFPGERLHPFDAGDGTDAGDDIEKSIRQKVLESGMAWSEYQYAGGVNRVRVEISDQENVLGRQITDLYRDKREKIRQRPLLLLRELVRWDPVRCVGTVVNRIVKRGSLLLIPVCTAMLIDRILEGKPFFSLTTLGLVMLALLLTALNCVCNTVFDRFFFSRKLREIEMGMKEALLRKLQVMDTEYLNKTPSGGILSKIIRDTENIRSMLMNGVSVGVQFLTDMLMIIVMALTNCPVMLVFYLVAVPIAAGLVSRFRGRIRDNTSSLRRESEKTSGVIRDMQEMRSLTRLHGVYSTEYQILHFHLSRVKRAGDEYDRVNHRFSAMTTFTFQFFQLACLVFALFLATRGAISIGLVVMFQSYFELMVNSVTKVIDALPEITRGYESLNSVNEVLCQEREERNGTVRLNGPLRGEIEFRDVVFRYGASPVPTVNHLSFRIPAGKSAAFVGDSGSGKTTIMNLITGVLTKESGEILIDGIDIDELDKSSFRRQIAVVPQNTVLFSGTLWDNLTYGQSYISSKDVLSVIDQIGFSDVIRSLPDGLSSMVQESGGNFSGGQRQRLSIARALLRKPRLLLFDEATSALDLESERQVQQAVERMMGQCTIIMIAHRLTTVRKCDLIFRVSPGEVRVFNSYDEFIREEERRT